MLSHYREIVPPMRLRDTVECFWTMTGHGDMHRVTPDGCADLLFTRVREKAALWAVGAMTRFIDPVLEDGQLCVGVRFRPGRWVAQFRVPGNELTDARQIRPVEKPSAVQKAIAYLEKQRGRVAVEVLAGQTGLSMRQFRRRCLVETGLTPKLLATILRFRHVLERVDTGGYAGLAIDCGYTDQSHLIADFRRFSGRTPVSLVHSRKQQL